MARSSRLGRITRTAVDPHRQWSAAAAAHGVELPDLPHWARRTDRYAMREIARALLPGSRTEKCGRLPVGAVSVVRHAGRCSYQGLAMCGSVWACPVCAARIGEVRRGEIDAAITRWRAQRGAVLLVTRTVPHGYWDELARLRGQLARARRAMKKSRRWREITAGMRHSVYALEVTHGENGWHPHEHELWFIDRALTDGERAALELELGALWRHCVRIEGLGETNEHGVDVRATDEDIAGYVAKWGAAAELTRIHTKRGRDGGRTPWDLLREAGAGDDVAARLWRQFAVAMKGARQLVWSRGARDALGLGVERTDEEIAERADVPVEHVCEIAPADWRLVVRARAYCAILQAAEHAGAAGVERILDRLRASDRAREGPGP